MQLSPPDPPRTHLDQLTQQALLARSPIRDQLLRSTHKRRSEVKQEAQEEKTYQDKEQDEGDRGVIGCTEDADAAPMMESRDVCCNMLCMSHPFCPAVAILRSLAYGKNGRAASEAYSSLTIAPLYDDHAAIETAIHMLLLRLHKCDADIATLLLQYDTAKHPRIWCDTRIVTTFVHKMIQTRMFKQAYQLLQQVRGHVCMCIRGKMWG